MSPLYFGLLLFGGPHVLSLLAPGFKTGLKAKLGENGYKGLYALLSLAGLVLLSMAYLRGRSGPASLDMVYEPLLWARHLTLLLAWIGWVLVAASHGKGYIKAWIKHPMSWGIGLWSLGHLLVNGERAVVYIFGLLLLIAILDIIVSTARGKLPTHEPRLRSDIIALVAGTAVFFVFALLFHPYVLNIPVLG